MSSTGLLPAQNELQAFGSTAAELSAGAAHQVGVLQQCCALQPGTLEHAIYTLKGFSAPSQRHWSCTAVVWSCFAIMLDCNDVVHRSNPDLHMKERVATIPCLVAYLV